MNQVPNPQRPTLLMVTTVPDFLEAFLLPFAQHYRERGWKVDALARDAGRSGLCRSAFDTVFDATWSRSPLDPANLRNISRIREIVRTGNYDIVHVHTPIASFLTRVALRHVRPRPRVVYTAHGFHFFPGAPWRNNLLYRPMEQVAGRWTDALVVINRDDEKAARKYRIVENRRLFYMPGIGIDLEKFSPEAVSAAHTNQLRQELDIHPGDPVLLQVGELRSGKRHADTLRAFAKTRGGRLLVAGDGPMRRSLQSFAASLNIENRVTFLGHRRDVPVLMALSDALVLVSAQEGLPRSIMEAMAMGKPVIGTTIRGTRDLLATGGGMLVPVGDISSISAAMETLMGDSVRAREMGARGRASVIAYDLRHILKLHDELYDEILTSSRIHGNASAQVAS